MRKMLSFICEFCGEEYKLHEAYVVCLKRDRALEPRFCSRKCKGANKTKKMVAKINIPEAIHLYTEDKITSKNIANKYGVTYNSIIKILRENGIEIRSDAGDTNRRKYNESMHGKRRSKEEIENIKTGTKKAMADPQLRDKLRKSTLDQMKNSKFANKNTSIERITASLLQSMSIKYEPQKVIGFWSFDFYLQDYNVLIECDGDYWHANPKFYNIDQINKTQNNNIVRGKAKQEFAERNGYMVVRFWEDDINNNIDNIITKLLEIKNTI